MPSPASQLPELASGHRLDRYELICPVAQGGMACVWLARQRGMHGFEKMVALKTILPSFAEDRRFRRMLLDEARLASRIEHVNVAQTLDLGEQDGHLYLVMEWVDGDSLSKLDRALEKASLELPLPVLLRVMVEACAGLHAAHELCDEHGVRLGVVHRDVSPQNILVSSKGQTKLIDFGIAKAEVGPSEETRAGILKGKINYMPPEQALRQPVDQRTDVWAIGAVIYRMLTRRTPYEGPSPVTSLRLLTARKPPTPLPDDIDPELRDLVHRALCPEPSGRPETALELQNALERFASGHGGMASPQELAAFVTQHLGHTLQERREKISKALRSANERDTVVDKAPGPSSTSRVRDTKADTRASEPPLEPDTGTLHPSISSSAVTLQMASHAPEAPTKRGWLVAPAAIALLGVGLWVLAGRSTTPAAGTGVTPKTASAAAPLAVAAPAPEPSAAPSPAPPAAAAPAQTSEAMESLPPPVLPSALPLSKAPTPRALRKPAPVKVSPPSPSKRQVVDDGF